jgi:hypothetical protein
LSSVASHAPLVQTSAAAAALHLPSNVGLACAASVGIAVPFESCGVHVCTDALHQLPPVQSASTLQPPAGWHLPFELQAPERQTVAAFVASHGPSPSA